MGYLFELFASCCTKTPDAPAVDVPGRVHTYRDLMDRVEALGAVLADGGVRPGARVGVAPLRGAEMYAVVAALSRQGCAVVPFYDGKEGDDRDRLRRLGVETLVVHSGEDTVVERIDGALTGAHVPEGCAYVIGTSGSTAIPKNVPISDANLRAFAEHFQSLGVSGEGDRLAQNYTTTFDGFFLMLVLAWTAGACLVLPARRENLLVDTFVRERGITVWNSVPSHLRMARRLGHLAEGSMPGVRVCVLAGEPLLPDLVTAWRTAAVNSSVVNLYGPSEVTIGSNTHTIEAGEPLRLVDGRIPIGPVFPSVESMLVPHGDDGEGVELFELCLRGRQRLTGYADPADNAGRFYAGDSDPLAPTEVTAPDEHSWYRSGDLVSRSELGLVHRGRRTREVKLLGRRVDLANVERVLGQDPRVEAAHAFVDGDVVIAAVEGKQGDGTGIDTSALRDYARPAEVVWVAAMPTLPNGKTDVLALEAGVRASLTSGA
ncbi:AMP-binding protein [Streptomyces hygroscopicus]|uniref:AMP-binding protein n=1 Tax=Streptomyces hygroscopicus TaxID=1912 RepID=UPI00099FE852